MCISSECQGYSFEKVPLLKHHVTSYTYQYRMRWRHDVTAFLFSTLRLRHTPVTTPHVRHICFRQENGNQIINFYKIFSFFHKYFIILRTFSTWKQFGKKKCGEPHFLDTYLLDFFSCGYISFSIPDDCLRPKRGVLVRQWMELC